VGAGALRALTHHEYTFAQSASRVTKDLPMTALTTPMLTAGLMLAFTFIGIFTEKVHGLERAKFGMLGAGLMVIAGNYFGFYDAHQVIAAVDWNVVLLLGSMMAIVELRDPHAERQEVLGPIEA